MTDKEVIVAMLDRAIEREKELGVKCPMSYEWEDRLWSSGLKDCEALQVEGHGYKGFVSEFRFNLDGSLRELNAWE